MKIKIEFTWHPLMSKPGGVPHFSPLKYIRIVIDQKRI